MEGLRLLLKREESYAIHALINIAENPGTNAARVAEQLELSKTYMAKVLRKLVEAGIIESQMGRSGGVRLKVAPQDLDLVTVIEAVSGPLMLDWCQAQARCATQRRKGYCKLNRAYYQAGREIRQVLQGVRVADLYEPAAEA